ncbi:MAG: glycosyltransferase [Planctomycetota bacterium]|jgi:glycosyltransferase involved in cell wall biosynthesis
MAVVFAHVLTTLGYGGAEMTALRLAERFDRGRFNQHVVAIRGGGPLEEEFRKNDIPVTIISKRGRATIPGALARLVMKFREIKPVLSFHYLSDAKVFGTIAAKFAGVPVIVHRQPNFLIGSSWYYRRLESCMARFAQHHIACSKSVADDTAWRTGIGRMRISAIHNGVPLEHYKVLPGKNDARKLFGLPEDKFIIVNIARFYMHQKAQRLLVHALSKLLSRGIDAQLVLVGDGPDRARLENIVARHGMRTHVTFLGVTNKIPEILAAADVFALSSNYEGFGIAVAEALAAGVPTVSTRCGGPEEILDSGKYGRLVPIKDPAAMADAIAELEGDRAERQRLAALGKKRAKNFSMDIVAERYAALFESLLRKKGLIL